MPVKETWGKKCPYAISNWENSWEDASLFSQFLNKICRIMYTTNIHSNTIDRRNNLTELETRAV